MPVIESLAAKVSTQTITTTALKKSVDSMNVTLSQQGTSIDKVLLEAPTVVHSALKQLYAKVLKESIDDTPKSSKKGSGSKPDSSKVKSSKPVINGTSEKLIGKPVSPNLNREANVVTTNQKAIWVSGLVTLRNEKWNRTSKSR